MRAIDGRASHRRGRVLAHPSVPPAAAELVAAEPPVDAILVDHEHAPNDLSVDERNVWLTMGPLALEKGTLHRSSAYAFTLLCKNIVLEKALRLTDGGGPAHRGLIQRIEAELGDFGLRAFGKPAIAAAAQPAIDPAKEKYFGGR